MSDDKLNELSVQYSLDQMVYLTAVGETKLRETPLPNWLVTHDLLWLAIELKFDHRAVELALMAEPEIDSIEELCDFLFDERPPRKIRRSVLLPTYYYYVRLRFIYAASLL